jgi:hypothetical protein
MGSSTTFRSFAAMDCPRRPLALLIAALLTIPAAQASVDLVAVGSLDGHGRDLSGATAAPLENGQPGNLLGGMGSGLAWAGGDTFLALPDRGPNATPYNTTLSDTASYIPRFHTLRMQLAASAPGSALPLTLTPILQSTTLLSSGSSLVYGNGTAAGVAPGAPALNAQQHRNFFSGRSDNFNPVLPSTSPQDARLDPEGIRVGMGGTLVYITDEYGPYMYRFDRGSGTRVGTSTLPAGYAITQLDSNGDNEIAKNPVGRVANKGMEGLAISPDGRYLYGVMQSALAQDGGTAAPYVRIVKLDAILGSPKEYVYALNNIGTAAKPKYPTVSEILAINDHEFLVDERDGKGLGDNSTAAYKRLYRIDLAQAQQLAGGASGAAALAPYAMPKSLFLDIVGALVAHGYSANDLPAKIEGMAFGPDVNVGGQTRHTLWIANDNDFIGTVTDSLHPGGIENPNRWFVFAFDDADLPGYVPQFGHR